MQWVCSWTFRLDFPFHVVFSCNNVKAIKHGLSAFRLVVVAKKASAKDSLSNAQNVNVILAIDLKLHEMM